MLRAAGSGIGIASGVQVVGKSAVAVACPADTTEDILATITVPAGAMGANGVIRMTVNFSMTSNANVKTPRVRWGGIGGSAIYNVPITTSVGASGYVYIQNRSSQATQYGKSDSITPAGALIAVIGLTSVDTSAATTIVVTGQKAVAGDTLTLESYLVELMYGA